MEYKTDFFLFSLIVLLFLKSGSDSSPVRNLQSFGTEEPAYSTRRVTRSQQQPTPVTPKKYPLRQTRSSGSETEQAVDFSDRGEWVWVIWSHYREDLISFILKEAWSRCRQMPSTEFSWVIAVCLIPFLPLAEDSLILCCS